MWLLNFAIPVSHPTSASFRHWLSLDMKTNLLYYAVRLAVTCLIIIAGKAAFTKPRSAKVAPLANRAQRSVSIGGMKEHSHDRLYSCSFHNGTNEPRVFSAVNSRGEPHLSADELTDELAEIYPEIAESRVLRQRVRGFFEPEKGIGSSAP